MIVNSDWFSFTTRKRAEYYLLRLWPYYIQKVPKMFYLTKNIFLNTIPSAVSIIVWTIIINTSFTISRSPIGSLSSPIKELVYRWFHSFMGDLASFASVGKSSNTIIPSTLVLSKYSLKKKNYQQYCYY